MFYPIFNNCCLQFYHSFPCSTRTKKEKVNMWKTLAQFIFAKIKGLLSFCLSWAYLPWKPASLTASPWILSSLLAHFSEVAANIPFLFVQSAFVVCPDWVSVHLTRKHRWLEREKNLNANIKEEHIQFVIHCRCCGLFHSTVGYLL